MTRWSAELQEPSEESKYGQCLTITFMVFVGLALGSLFVVVRESLGLKT